MSIKKKINVGPIRSSLKRSSFLGLMKKNRPVFNLMRFEYGR